MVWAKVLERTRKLPKLLLAVAVEREPEDSWLYKKLGDALRAKESGKGDRIEKRHQSRPKIPLVLRRIGLTSLANSSGNLRITNLIQTLQIKPDLFGIYYHIAYALAQKHG
jgi:hypothetical protein